MKRKTKPAKKAKSKRKPDSNAAQFKGVHVSTKPDYWRPHGPAERDNPAAPAY